MPPQLAPQEEEEEEEDKGGEGGEEEDKEKEEEEDYVRESDTMLETIYPSGSQGDMCIIIYCLAVPKGYLQFHFINRNIWLSVGAETSLVKKLVKKSLKYIS